MARSITTPTATREQCARLEQFAQGLGIDVEELHPPITTHRVTQSTTLSIDDARELEVFARERGTTAAIILRGAVVAVLKAARGAPSGGD